MLDVLTIFLLSIVISFSLGGAICLTSSTEPESGLGKLAYALICHGLAYSLLFASQWLGPVAVWLAEVCFALLFAFALAAFATFHRLAISRGVYVALVAPNALVSALFATDLSKRITFNTPVLTGIVLFTLVVAFRRRRTTVGRGQYLVIAANALVGLALLYRGIGAIMGMTDLKRILDTDLAQIIVYVTSLAGLNLLAIGFVLMAKERTDHINRELILRDKMIGIWNRRKIEEVGAGELKRLLRYGTPVTLLMMDLDNFKPINDRFGHAAGDHALRAVAAACGDMLRETDIFGRWGGEEFVVILPGTGVDAALELAERLRQAVSGIGGDAHRRLTISIGVSLCLSTDSWASWLERADAALYEAKAAGKNRVVFDIPLHRVDGVPQVRWSEALTTGINALDADHHDLVEMANELLRVVSLEYDKPRTLALLSAIADRTIDHFEQEEKLIAALHPDELDEHKATHSTIVARFRFLENRLRSDALPLEALVQFIVFEMCAQHMAGDDRRVFGEGGAPTALCA